MGLESYGNNHAFFEANRKFAGFDPSRQSQNRLATILWSTDVTVFVDA
jgi:hypothetical protein